MIGLLRLGSLVVNEESKEWFKETEEANEEGRNWFTKRKETE